MGRKIRALFVILFATGGMSARASEAATVEVVVFDVRSQSVVECASVTMFRWVVSDREEKTRFAGCTAKTIPFGMYAVGVTTAEYKLDSVGKCEIDSRNSVCIVAVSHPGTDYVQDSFQLSCIECGEANEKIVFVVQSVYTGSRQVFAAKVGERTEVWSQWMDLIVTVLVKGKPLGSAYLDRRQQSSGYVISPGSVGSVLAVTRK
jgi:hypothetical protein